MNEKHIVIIGSAHPLRGGLASFNERLAQQLMKEGARVDIYTFSLQYPSFLFPGTSQYSDQVAPQALSIKVCINSINPLNWIKIGYQLKKIKPDIIVVRYWLPFMAPCLGTILRMVRRNKHTKIICIADNIIPHEKRRGDRLLTKYFLPVVDEFIVMSEKVQSDLKNISHRHSSKVEHPLYDNFGEAIDKNKARTQLGIPPNTQKLILFFGFIRAYKGLDMLLEAMAEEGIKTANIHLLIAGEFYENKEPYLQQISNLGIAKNLHLRTSFIPDSEVKLYLSACDFVIQPYHKATQSGVTPLAYHFDKAMLVTNVGGLPAIVPHQKVGIVCEPNSKAIAQGILDLYAYGEDFFKANILQEKKKYSWQNITRKIFDLSK